MKACVFLALALFLAITVAGCTRSADKLPAADAPQPEATDTTAEAPAEPPAEEAHAAAFRHAGQEGVTPGATSGNVEFLPVASDYPCATRDDCTSTKYSNVPRSGDDCQCAASCTPYVVNKAEAARREQANKAHCDDNDWYGDQCPAPPCGFMEFESFKCEAGKCLGMAIGK